MIRRREFLKAGVAGGVLVATPTLVGAQTSKGKVRLAYLQLGWAATEIIHKEDLLGKRGWQTEYSVVPGSPVPLLNQLTSKNVDAIDMSFALAAKQFEDGAPIKVTGVATAVLGAIVARKDAGLAKVEDLKGKKVAAVVGTSTFFDIRALTLFDRSLAFVPRPVRFAESALTMWLDRTRHLARLSSAYELDGSIFGAYSRRWDLAVPTTSSHDFGIGIVGVGFSLASRRPGRSSIRLDYGVPVVASAGAQRTPRFSISLTPWFGAGRRRDKPSSF